MRRKTLDVSMAIGMHTQAINKTLGVEFTGVIQLATANG